SCAASAWRAWDWLSCSERAGLGWGSSRRGLRGDAVASERPWRGQRPGASALLGGAGGTEADRAGQRGAAEPAVPEGILREVLLVIVLSEVELRGVQDLGGDAAVAGAVQHALVGVRRRVG